MLKAAKYVYLWAKNILFIVGFMFIAILASYSIAYSRVPIPSEVKLDVRPLVADNSLRYFWMVVIAILVIGGIIEIAFGIKRMFTKKPKVEGAITSDENVGLKILKWIITH